MYRLRSRPWTPIGRFPHMRGDVPFVGSSRCSMRSFSPHAWGCTGSKAAEAVSVKVFPTCVGMYRPCDRRWWRRICFPHMRGDVPNSDLYQAHVLRFSPHAWGCTVFGVALYAVELVFPTCVGMYRPSRKPLTGSFRFPHMRGDVPIGDPSVAAVARFSPHAWGCTGYFRGHLER